MRLNSNGRDNEIVPRRLAIGRRISEYISKSHNARVRYAAYECFIKLIESNKKDFTSVWKHRMDIPRKRKEGEDFLNALRSQASPADEGVGRLAARLLWLLEEINEHE